MRLPFRLIPSSFQGFQVLCCGVALSLGAWAGDITGTISLTSSVGPRKQGEVRDTTRYEDKGDVPSPSEAEVENVVVYLQGEKLACTPLTRKGPRNSLEQRNKEFKPHVLPIPKGSKIYFLNSDPFPHHVYSVSETATFELAKFLNGIRSQAFDSSGEVEIFCGIHTKMNAYILVVDNDYYCKPDREGKYRLAGVPAGQYNLMIWHPRLPKPEKRPITVPASGALKLDLKV